MRQRMQRLEIELDSTSGAQRIGEHFDDEADLFTRLVLQQIVLNMHDAGRAGGRHIVDIGPADILHLVVIDLDCRIIVGDAVAAGTAAADGGVLHLLEFHAGYHLQKLSRLVADSLATHHVAGVVVGHPVGQPSQLGRFDIKVFFNKFINIKDLLGEGPEFRALLDKHLDLLFQGHAARRTGDDNRIEIIMAEQVKIVLHEHLRPLVIAVGQHRGAVALLPLGNDHLITVAGEDVDHRFHHVGINEISGTAGKVADAHFGRTFFCGDDLRVLALGASKSHLGKEAPFGKAEQGKKVAHRIARTDAEEGALGNSDEHGGKGNRPLAPQQLSEDEGLEETEALLGGDVPA